MLFLLFFNNFFPSTQKDCVVPIYLCTAIQENLKAFRILSYEAPFIIRCVTTKRKDNGSKDD